MDDNAMEMAEREIDRLERENARLIAERDAFYENGIRKGEENARLIEERNQAWKQLADAAREINCAGPIAHRIRILKSEMEAENARLRGAMYGAGAVDEDARKKAWYLKLEQANISLSQENARLREALENAKLEMIRFGNIAEWPPEMSMSYAEAINKLKEALKGGDA